LPQQALVSTNKQKKVVLVTHISLTMLHAKAHKHKKHKAKRQVLNDLTKTEAPGVKSARTQ
jgi:hypothetical protein